MSEAFETKLDELVNRLRKRGYYEDGQVHYWSEEDLAEYRKSLHSEITSTARSCVDINETDLDDELMRILQLRWDEDVNAELQFLFMRDHSIEVYGDYNQPGKVSEVKLDFSPEEWSDVLDKYGEWLPYCCANISRVRDVLTSAKREGGVVGSDELYEAAYLIREHDEGCPTSGPMARIVEIESLVRPHMVSQRAPVSLSLERPEDCVAAASRALYAMDTEQLFSSLDRPPKREEYRDEKGFQRAVRSNEERQFTHKMFRTISLAKIIPALKGIWDKIDELDLGPIEGWAIMKEDGTVAETRSGLAIYIDLERCQEVLQMWARDLEEQKANDEKFHSDKDDRTTEQKARREAFLRSFVINQVRITKEKGLEVVGSADCSGIVDQLMEN